MSKSIARLTYATSLLAAFGAALLPSSALATTCTEDKTKKAWGDFWIERSGANCDCDIYMRQYLCVANESGVHDADSPTLIATVAGDCSKACEDLSGYAAGIATALGKYVPGTGNYECDSAFEDADQDGYGSCIDADDTDPRVWLNADKDENVCDGVDNDADGTVDDGFGSMCATDQKRLDRGSSYQGDAASRVHLIDGAMRRTETDVAIEGPYGPLTFTRTYSSRRETNDAALGKGWTHSFAVYLTLMPAGDDRYQVMTPTGEHQYFRCSEWASNMTCVIDDHRPRGNLRRISGTFYYYPGDGTKYTWTNSGLTSPFSTSRLFAQHLDGNGYVLATATADGSERVTKVESANSSIYLSFAYDTNGLDVVRVNSTTGKQVLDVDVGSYSGTKLLDKVKFASALNTIDTDTFIAYSYPSSTTRNLESITQKLDGSTTLTVGSFTYDGSDRVTAIQDATKKLAVSYSTGLTQVTYNVGSSGNPSTTFTHNGLWVTTRDAELHVGGASDRTVVYDEHGRVTCSETDDSRVLKLVYTDSRLPIEYDYYGKTGTCVSGGSIDHKVWRKWEYNTGTQSWRPVWVRRPSVYSGASDCTGSSLPAGCAETKYEYPSSSDDRVQWITETGYSKLVDDTTPQQIRKRRFFYFTLDSGTCTSGDSYTGLLCREETQNNSSTVFARTDFTYVPSGATAGLLKTVARSKASGSTLTTQYGSHNDFGSPTVITDESGLVTTLTMNGWNAVTQAVETDAMIAGDGTLPDPTTSYSYTKLRRIDTITLPKGNKQITKYLTGGSDYARVKAWATADPSGNLLEIKRFDYDNFGHRTEEKIIDSINGTTPCADETCTTYESRRQWKLDALGRLVNTYLHATDTADPADATASYTYTNGQVTSTQDYLGVTTTTTYDDQGRVASVDRDDGGLNVTTTYAYDSQGRLLTTTSPTSVDTRTEHDDFGQLVLERSKTRGDLRYEYDTTGFMTKRRRSSYNSSSNAESICYTYDWLGRQKTVDDTCDASVEWTLYYDGASLPSSSCATNTVQTGHLSTVASADFTRVLCYHPNGMIHSVFQIDSSTWSNTSAKGTTRIYDLNGNLSKEYLWDRPSGHTYAREVEYLYSSTLADRVDSIRHKLTSDSSWTAITSASVHPTYFPFGGFKTVEYGNLIDETNSRDSAYRLTERKTAYGVSKYTDIVLGYDVGGNITRIEDTADVRHHSYYAAYDKLNRLRCLSRASISACTGSEPWENAFVESLDYDASGNRTNRRYGAFNTADDDAYTYVTGSDIIDKVTSGGTDKEMSNTFRGEITTVNQPSATTYTYDQRDHVIKTSDQYLADTIHDYTVFSDRYRKVSACNTRKSYYYYTPGSGGTSHEVKLINLFGTCADEYPRQLRAFIYLEGRPIAVVHSTVGSGSDAQTEVDTYWIHTDQLGTPVYVTTSNRTERWRWENDPFGVADPVEYTVSAQDVNPDDSTGNPYATCCCSPACGGGCGACTTGCTNTQCTGSGSQGVVWTKTYAPTSANNVRVHFTTFDVKAGSTRTGKDYLTLYKSNGTTVVATLTGALGDFWSPWSNDAGMVVKLTADNVADGTAGVVIDKLEYTTATNGRFVMQLRMPGQIWDEDALASHNWHRWYRSKDGRYLSPDPMGLDGGDPALFSYVGGAPLGAQDPSGLATMFGDFQRKTCGCGVSVPVDEDCPPCAPPHPHAGQAQEERWFEEQAALNFLLWLLSGGETELRPCSYTILTVFTIKNSPLCRDDGRPYRHRVKEATSLFDKACQDEAARRGYLFGIGKGGAPRGVGASRFGSLHGGYGPIPGNPLLTGFISDDPCILFRPSDEDGNGDLECYIVQCK